MQSGPRAVKLLSSNFGRNTGARNRAGSAKPLVAVLEAREGLNALIRARASWYPSAVRVGPTATTLPSALDNDAVRLFVVIDPAELSESGPIAAGIARYY